MDEPGDHCPKGEVSCIVAGDPVFELPNGENDFFCAPVVVEAELLVGGPRKNESAKFVPVEVVDVCSTAARPLPVSATDGAGVCWVNGDLDACDLDTVSGAPPNGLKEDLPGGTASEL